METLILSAAWEPMEIVSWERAMTLLFMQKVEVVEEYEDRSIRTVSIELKMPSVVRFVRVLRSRKLAQRGASAQAEGRAASGWPAIKFSRQNVWARDKGRCQYCGKKTPRHEATYDHVVPRAQRGPTRWENVVIACVRCNQKKGNRTPEQARMRLLSVPVKPSSLPGGVGLSVTYRKGMPPSWSQFLTDTSYWYGELEK